MDVPDVLAPLTAEVTLQVPFRPARSRFARTMRRLLRAVWARPCQHTFRFIEPPPEHILGYIALVNEQARVSLDAARPAVTADVLAGLDQHVERMHDHALQSGRMMAHVTGIDDPDLFAALTSGQRAALVAGYESVNPTLAEFKKKLDALLTQAQLIAAAEVARTILDELGPLSSTSSPPDTAETPSPSPATPPGPSDASGSTTSPPEMSPSASETSPPPSTEST